MSSNRRTKHFFVSTISDNPSRIFENLKLFEQNKIEGIHFDIMDGIFVPRLGLYPELLREIHRHTKLPIEVHLMTVNIQPYIETLALYGASRVIFHVETKEDIEILIREARSNRLDVGMAISPDTDLDKLTRYLGKIDFIMLMAVHPGSVKKPLLSETFTRLTMLREILKRELLSMPIAIDGGITFDNIEPLSSLGADYFVCGSGTIFSPRGTLEQNLANLSGLLDTK